MAWVETRITRTTQPQDAAVGIDWDNPNSDGLALLVDHQGKALFDLASEQITRTGTVSRSVTQKGLALGSVATGSLLSNTRHFVAPTNTAFSVVGTIAIGNTAQTNRYLAIARDNAGVGNQVALIYGYVAGKLEFFAPQRTGTDPRASSGITINDSKPHTFGYSYDGLNWIGYLDGVRVFSTTLTFNCNIGSNSKGSLLSALSANTLDGSVLSWATFDQGVGDARLKSLTANPHQLLEPEVTRIWVDDYVSAGGGATVIPIGVQATGSVGTPSATGAATTTPAGVSASSAVGTPVAVGGASIPATVLPAGVQSTGAVGTVSATGAAVAQPAGVTASGAVGTPVAIAGTSIPATVLPAGVQASSAVGTPAAQGAAIAQPLGVAATAYVGTPTIATGVSGVAVAYPAGVQAIGQVGTLIATGAAWTAAVGVQAVASVGTPTVYAGEIVIYVAGAQTRPSRLQSSSRPSRLQSSSRPSRIQTGTRPSR